MNNMFTIIVQGNCESYVSADEGKQGNVMQEGAEGYCLEDALKMLGCCLAEKELHSGAGLDVCAPFYAQGEIVYQTCER